MAAVNGALMSMLSAGDHVVAARALLGHVYTFWKIFYQVLA